MRFLCLLLAALLAASPVHAQDVWHDQDGPAPPHPSRASQQGFGAMLMLTPDHDGFLQAWAGSTPPNVVTTNEAERNQPVSAMLIFRGCRAGGDGNCNVTAEFIILRPDGVPYGEAMRGPVWNAAPAPGNNLQLSISIPGIRVEAHDPRGSYVFRAIVTDHVANITLQVEETLTVNSPATDEVS